MVWGLGDLACFWVVGGGVFFCVLGGHWWAILARFGLVSFLVRFVGFCCRDRFVFWCCFGLFCLSFVVNFDWLVWLDGVFVVWIFVLGSVLCLRLFDVIDSFAWVLMVVV